MADGIKIFPSYHAALKDLPDEMVGKVMKAVFAYAFAGEEPEDLDGVPRAIFELLRPSIEKSMEISKNRSEAGKAGGRPSKSKPDAEEKQTESKPKANRKQKNDLLSETKNGEGVGEGVGVGEGEGVGVGEGVGDKKPARDAQGSTNRSEKPNTSKPLDQQATESMISKSDLSDPVKDELRKWTRYKREKRDGYKETGLEALLNRVGKEEKRIGADLVIQCIESSMASNWQGLFFDKAGTRTARSPSGESLVDRWANA